MLNNLFLRTAEKRDLYDIIRLFAEDDLGVTREDLSAPLSQSYQLAFQEIKADKHQALLVVDYNEKVIGTCHLTFLPSLSFKGSKRLNVENIHIDKKFQNQGVGTWMIQKIFTIGKDKGCKIVQLTTNKKRFRAKAFYEKLGFVASHEGMKLYL